MVALTSVGVIGLRAQGQQENPLTAILAKLDHIITLVTPPDPPTVPAAVTLSTPAVYVGVGQMVSCYASNVGTGTIAEIRIRRVNFATGAILQSASFANVAAEQSVTTPGAFDSQSQRCEYTFEGTASMVRAAL